MNTVALGKNVYMRERKEAGVSVRGKLAGYVSRYGAEIAANMLSLTQDANSYRQYLSVNRMR